MKVMLIHPGDEFSTHDVYVGLHDALVEAGHTIIEARLDDGLSVMTEAVRLLTSEHCMITPLPPWATDAFGMCASRIVAQAAWLKPDVAIAVTGLKLHPSAPLTLRKMGIPTIMLCTETPYMEAERHLCACYDHIFTHERAAIPARWFGDHPSVHYLPHAYNPKRHRPGPADPDYAADVFFVGTAFPERQQLFAGVNWQGIRFTVKGALWHAVSDDATYAELFQGITPNDEVARYYRSSAININHHRTTLEWGTDQHLPLGAAESLGPRAYEIAACGGFQLMDDSRPEARDIFGDAYIAYRAGDSADLERQIRYYLSRPDERAAIAALQQQAVQVHTWFARVPQLLSVL